MKEGIELKKDIILIGPVGAGKSTIGEMLSSKLNMPQCSMDKIRRSIYDEIGYDQELVKQIDEKEGFLGVYRYWKPFEAYAVKTVLARYQGYIHDFGAGHSVYEDPKLFEEVKKALDDYINVVLLLPSPDKERSRKILFKRKGFEFNYLFIDNPSNEKLAKIVIYTEGKTEEDVCNEILEKLN